MMTPEEERLLIESVAAGLDEAALETFKDVLTNIRAGIDPGDAVQEAFDTYGAEITGAMSIALTKILGEAVSEVAVAALTVGGVSLSRKLWSEAAQTSEVVAGIVDRHLKGFQDARKLALDLFEGYRFRAPGDEPLQLNPRNPKLPKYLREALLPDQGLQTHLAKAFARIQVDNLTAPALKAAYAGVLEAIDLAEHGLGSVLLENRLKVAYFERVRYFAQRIAQTELHKSFAAREAAMMIADVDIEFVQVRRAPGRRAPCICTLFTGRDQYGLGPGVYPKVQAPLPPFHPFCRCYMVPRLDLTGRMKAKGRDPDADAYFLDRLKEPIAARIMGSKANRDQVLRGIPAEAVANARRDPMYWIKQAGQVRAN